jgi:hypothetical protein
MLKHKITYENYDEDQVTEELYFNLTKNELVALEVEHHEGMYKWLEKIAASKDRKTIYDETRKIVLLAYGEKTPDGRSFLKTPEITEAFAHTAAFHKLMEDLVFDEDMSATFMKGILPKDLMAQVEAEEKKQEAQKAAEKNVEERNKAEEEAKETPPNS